MNNILILAPHPDDETLGCGGTLLKEKKMGSKIHWVIGTSMYEKNGWDTKLISKRNQEIDIVQKKYNFDSTHFLELPTTLVDEASFPEIIKKIEKIFKKIKPKIVFIPFYKDIHTDHQILSKAAVSCTKWFRFPSIKKILYYETLSETHWSQSDSFFNPNVYVDISKFINKKIEIMKIYKSEIKQSPFPRSEKNIKAKAIFNGSMSGYSYAEAFQLLLERD